MDTLVDTTLNHIFERKKSNSFLSLNRFNKSPSTDTKPPPSPSKPPQSPSKPTEQTYNRIFSKPPLPKKIECLQSYDRDNFAIPRAKSESSVSCHQGDVVLRRRSSTQITAEIMERRNSRLSRVSVNSSVFDLAFGSRRNSVASMESGCSNVTLEQSEKEWIVKSAQGDCDTISRLLLTERSLVQYKDFISGYTGLHWSCKLGRLDITRVLLDAGSDPCARSHSGQTPLHLAAQTGKGPVIDLLLQSGADKETRDYKGKKPGHYLPTTAAAEVKSLLVIVDPRANIRHGRHLNLPQIFLDSTTSESESTSEILKPPKGRKKNPLFQMISSSPRSSRGGRLSLAPSGTSDNESDISSGRKQEKKERKQRKQTLRKRRGVTAADISLVTDSTASPGERDMVYFRGQSLRKLHSPRTGSRPPPDSLEVGRVTPGSSTPGSATPVDVDATPVPPLPPKAKDMVPDELVALRDCTTPREPVLSPQTNASIRPRLSSSPSRIKSSWESPQEWDYAPSNNALTRLTSLKRGVDGKVVDPRYQPALPPRSPRTSEISSTWETPADWGGSPSPQVLQRLTSESALRVLVSPPVDRREPPELVPEEEQPPALPPKSPKRKRGARRKRSDIL